jgi:hypothetical protein
LGPEKNLIRLQYLQFGKFKFIADIIAGYLKSAFFNDGLEICSFAKAGPAMALPES